jgi:hypothetical protein
MEQRSSWEAYSALRYSDLSSFMEAGGPLPCSQKAATGPRPEPDESTPPPQTVSLSSVLTLPSHLRLILPGDNVPFRFSNQNFLSICHFAMRAACPTHLAVIRLIILIIFWRMPYCGAVLISFSTLLSLPLLLILLKSKYSPQHRVLRQCQSVFFP